ncbi:MAG: hypothetical protein AAGD07_02770 [Planctomycetota bacterium]
MQWRSTSKPGRRERDPRRGSALVLCMLAVAVMSLSAIAIVRNQQRASLRARSVRDRAMGQAVADGLMHRHVALVRNSGGFVPVNPDPELDSLGYDQTQTTLSVDTVNNEVSVSVLLYPTAPAGRPASSTTSEINP